MQIRHILQIGAGRRCTACMADRDSLAVGLAGAAVFVFLVLSAFPMVEADKDKQDKVVQGNGN